MPKCILCGKYWELTSLNVPFMFWNKDRINEFEKKMNNWTCPFGCVPE